jgi:hypothetical protein
MASKGGRLDMDHDALLQYGAQVQDLANVFDDEKTYLQADQVVATDFGKVPSAAGVAQKIVDFTNTMAGSLDKGKAYTASLSAGLQASAKATRETEAENDMGLKKTGGH